MHVRCIQQEDHRRITQKERKKVVEKCRWDGWRDEGTRQKKKWKGKNKRMKEKRRNREFTKMVFGSEVDEKQEKKEEKENVRCKEKRMEYGENVTMHFLHNDDRAKFWRSDSSFG